MVQIMGSLPLLPADPVLHDRLFATIGMAFAHCSAVALPSVPKESWLWSYVRGSQSLEGNFIPYANFGINGCHTIPLLGTVEEYRARLGGKKRHNLNRQVRMLRDLGGGRLELRRIEYPDEVGDLVRLMDETRRSARRGQWGRICPPAIDRREAEDLARRGLLLDYLLLCGGKPCAIIAGRQYRGVYHMDWVSRDRHLDRFSPGTTALHLAIEDLLRETSIRRIDLGYSYPAYSHSATNVVEPRASLLLLRRTIANRIGRNIHSMFRSVVRLGKACLATRPGLSPIANPMHGILAR
jgi:hypothetical protein